MYRGKMMKLFCTGAVVLLCALVLGLAGMPGRAVTSAAAGEADSLGEELVVGSGFESQVEYSALPIFNLNSTPYGSQNRTHPVIAAREGGNHIW